MRRRTPECLSARHPAAPLRSPAASVLLAIVAHILFTGSATAQVHPAPPLGAKPFVTLLCKYADFPDLEPASRDHFTQIMGAPTHPSVNHYWTEVGNGRFSLTGSQVAGWFLLPRPSTHYVGTYAVRYADLHDDCIAAADAAVNFADFHGINIVVNGSLNGVLTAGAVAMSRDGVERTWVTTYLDATIVNSFGLAAHEIGHTFGLAHTSGPYGATYDSYWDVMSASAWSPIVGTAMTAPAHPNAYQKRYLGIIPPERVLTAPIGTTDATLERHALPAANGDPLMLVVPIPGPAGAGPYTSALPYYTVELRGGPGSGYDAAFPEPVAVVHLVDPLRGVTVVDVDANGDPNDAGARWTAGETFIDRANDIAIGFVEHSGSAMRVSVRVGDRNMIAIAPGSRRRELAFGDTATRADSATITVTGPTATSVAWSATTSGPARRIVVSNASGTGSATLRFTMHPTQLAPGTYVDTVTVTADVAVNRVVRLVDTLVVGAASDLVAGLLPPSRADSLLPGQTRTLTAFVLTGGTGADTVSWTATARASWIAVLRAAGRGTRDTLRWTHDASASSPGTYVDTIAVTLSSGATARLVDTLRVLPRPTLALSRQFGSLRVPQQSGPRIDSVFVTVGGGWGAGVVVTTGYVQSSTVFLVGDPRPLVGGGWFRFQRNPGTLAPGTYVNRLPIALGMDPAQTVTYEDTLHVEAAPPRLALSATSRRDTIALGAASMDSVQVQPEGSGALGLKWESRANYDRTLLLPRNGSLPFGSGTGRQWIAWGRNTAGDGPGVYVDTIWVRFATVTADSVRLIDTLVIRAAPGLFVAATSRRATTMVGATGPLDDSTAVTAEDGATWSATNRRPWVTLLAAGGAGADMLRWRRGPTGLPAGTHVDTITVVSQGLAGSPHRIVDTLVVWPALAIRSDSARPAAVMGATYRDVLVAEGASGTYAWAITAGALPAGVALDTAGGVLSGIPTERGTFRFTVRVRSDEFLVERAFALDVGIPALAADAVLAHLLGGTRLADDHARFLDLQGNRNGRTDIGDVRAWLMAQPAAPVAVAPAAVAPSAREAKDSATARLRALAGGPR